MINIWNSWTIKWLSVKSWAWWHTALSSLLRKQMQAYLWVWSQHSLQSEFQARTTQRDPGGGKKPIVNQWIGQNLMVFYLTWQNTWTGISLTWYMDQSLSSICVVHCYKPFPAAALHGICHSCYWNVKTGLRSLGRYGTCSSDQDYWASSGRMMKKW